MNAAPPYHARTSICLLATSLWACEVLAPVDAVNQGDAAAQAPGCAELAPSKVVNAEAGSSQPAWRVALVPLTASSECIYVDKTEVNVAAYTAWAQESGDFVDWHPWCVAWKSGGPSNPAQAPADSCAGAISSNQVEPFAPDKPIRCVDWCDAEAFCRAARGGHLCHRSTGGGSFQPDHQQDEWPAACSNSGTTVWPWGDDAGASPCNLDRGDAGCGATTFSCGPVAGGTFSACVDGQGIFDLIGNVKEWLGNCVALGITTSAAACATAGGGYDDSIASVTCAPVGSEFAKGSRRPDLGFRCCYDLTPEERQAAGLP